MSTEGSTAFAGAEINMAGGSNVNTVSIFNIGDAGTSTIIAGLVTKAHCIIMSPSIKKL